jgi:LacI family transcriptional regulator
MEDVPNPNIKTLRDIARAAGVSLATVDRVLHDRPGVRPATFQRVKETIERHKFRPHAAAAELARSRQRRFAFVMPSGPNLFMQQILAQLGELDGWMRARRVTLNIVSTDVLDPECLVHTLESFSGVAELDAVAVVALDHPRVRAVIDDLVAGGKKVITLISDVPSSRRCHYVGIDNIAAGRTAGALVGRLTGGRAGKIAVVAGSQDLRDHAERVLGFRQVINAEFPAIEILPVSEGRDDDHRSENVTQDLLRQNEDVVGLYNVGAGTEGVANAIIKNPRRNRLIFVGHDFTAVTRRLLLNGVMDAAISQNPGHQARAAVRVLLALATDEPILSEQEKIRIDIIMRDNMP